MKDRLYQIVKLASKTGKTVGLQKAPLIRRIYYPVRDFLAPDVMKLEYEGYDLYYVPGMPHRRVKSDGIFEPEVTSAISNFTSKGDTVFDIGGYLGYHTLSLRRSVGDKGRVITFEPDPTNANLLEQTISHNDLTNVTLEQMAVSNTTGSEKLSIPEVGPSLPSIATKFDDATEIAVNSTTLSDYIERNNLSEASFAKIDVEGGEYDIICKDDGFTNLDTMIVEIHEGLLSGGQIDEIIDRLSKHGNVTGLNGGEIDRTGNFHILYQCV